MHTRFEKSRELKASGSLMLSRIQRQQEGALARTSKDAVPFRACFLFDNSPNLYNCNAKQGFSQGTGWELMDQSAPPCLPSVLLPLTSGMCLMKRERLLQTEDTDVACWGWDLQEQYTNVIRTLLASNSISKLTTGGKAVLKPLLSIVFIMNSHMLRCSLGGCRHPCSVLVWSKSFFSVAF